MSMNDVPRARPRVLVGSSSSISSTTISSTIARPPRHSRSQSTGKMRIMGGLESTTSSNSSTNNAIMDIISSSSSSSSSYNTKVLLVPRNAAAAIAPQQPANVIVPQCAQHVYVAMNLWDTYLLSSNGDVLKSISATSITTTTTNVGSDGDTSNRTAVPNTIPSHTNTSSSTTTNNSSMNNITTEDSKKIENTEEEDYSSTVTVDQYGDIISLPSFDYSYVVDSPTASVNERKQILSITTATTTAKTAVPTLLQSIVEVPSPADSCSSCCSTTSLSRIANNNNNKFSFNSTVDNTTTTTTTTTAATTTTITPPSTTTIVPTVATTTDTNNTMVPLSSNTSNHNNNHKQQRPMIPGIPQKVSFFHDLRVTTISTHPMGNHVLFLSSSGLLFAFGDNRYGQCGVGGNSTNKAIITEPTMVTAFLENGGKASAISAGVDYSLVVVRTNLERIEKLLRSKHHHSSSNTSTYPTTSTTANSTTTHHPPPSSVVSNTTTSTSLASGSSAGSSSNTMMTHVGHHQMYAFGNNEGDKLGLVNGKTSPGTTTTTTTATPSTTTTTVPTNNIVPLPRRVALHSKIFSDEDYIMPSYSRRGNSSSSNSNNNSTKFRTTTTPVLDDCPTPGIFCVEASQYHSMALVHLPDGTVELYSWGISPAVEYGALGFCLTTSTTSTTEPNDSSINSTTTTPTLVLTSRQTSSPHSRRKDFPLRIALGLHCSLITYKSGQVLSMGYSSDGLLGLGPGIVSSPQPTPIFFEKSTNSNSNSSSSSSSNNVLIRQVSIGQRHAIAISSSGQAYSWGIRANGRLGQDSFNSNSTNSRTTSEAKISYDEEASTINAIQWTPQLVTIESISCTNEYTSARGSAKVYRGVAGPDASIFIMSDGQVLSCGKKSGQLGQGTIKSDSIKPAPMFGGLYLWKDEEEHHHHHHHSR